MTRLQHDLVKDGHLATSALHGASGEGVGVGVGEGAGAREGAGDSGSGPGKAGSVGVVHGTASAESGGAVGDGDAAVAEGGPTVAEPADRPSGDDDTDVEEGYEGERADYEALMEWVKQKEGGAGRGE